MMRWLIFDESCPVLPVACRLRYADTLCSGKHKDHVLVDQVGTTVRRLRHAAGLSQEELAERCDLHRTYIGAIERGEKTITIITARKLADAFELTLSEFFTQVDQVALLLNEEWNTVWQAQKAEIWAH